MVQFPLGYAKGGYTMSNGIQAPTHHIELHTGSKARNYEIEWVVENFELLDLPVGEGIMSAEFSTGEDTEQMWCLGLYPRGKTSQNTGYLSLLLISKSDGMVSTKFKFAVLNSGGGRIEVKSCNYIYKNSDEAYGIYSYLNRDNVLKNSGTYLKNCNLRIVCNLQVLDNLKYQSTCKNGLYSKNISSGEDQRGNKSDWSQSELIKILEDTASSDMKLMVGEKELQVHKTILRARSPVFAAMLEHPLKEARTGQVEITDIPAEVMEAVVRYMYTGEAPSCLEKATSALLMAADKYQLAGLKEMCVRQLEGRLAPDCALDLLLLADRHQEADLKGKVLEFISKNVRPVLSQPSWKEMVASNSQLVSEVQASIIENNFIKLNV